MSHDDVSSYLVLSRLSSLDTSDVSSRAGRGSREDGTLSGVGLAE